MAAKKSAKKKATKKTTKRAGAKALKTSLIVYHMNSAAGKRSEKMRAATPDAGAEGMKLWMAWAKKCGDKLVVLGSPLGNGVKLDPKGASPSKRDVAGYSILKASSMAEAKKLMQNHPHIGWGGGCDIEVHESLPLPGM
jgi:hypothetical protein